MSKTVLNTSIPGPGVPMQKPSWVDALALVVVVAVAVVLGEYNPVELHPRFWDFIPPENAFVSGARKLRQFVEALTPASFGFAVVGLARALREPRPSRRLVFRQPGVAACAAIVAAIAAGIVSTSAWIVRWLEFREPWLTPGAGMVIGGAASRVSYCILATWAFLACGGLWAWGRNWVNWLGCALGILLLVNSVLGWLP
ncbi:MAG: hypothetical protein ACLQIB_08230 [Isosphaeraceae bacterium]